MRHSLRLLVAAVLLVGLTGSARAEDEQVQRDPSLSSLRVSVLDQTGAAILGATVSIALPPGDPKTATTNERGEVTFDNLTPGKYLLHVESAGFETVDIAEVNVRRGRQERREVRLEIGRFAEEVEVTRDRTDELLNDSFSTALTQEQIDALPDDEEEMAAQLEQMAGPGATLRVNGFSGGRLPPKSQIAEIRFRFDPYSAENHESGFPRVDIRTRPGNGNWRNSAGFTFRDESLNATPAFAPSKGAEQARRYQWSIDGPLVKGRTSFSLNVGGLNQYETETTLFEDPGTGERLRGLTTQPTERVNFNARVEHAITKNQLLRLEYSRNDNTRRNLGVGEFDLPERGYDSESQNNELRISTSGGLFKKARNEFRFELNWDDSVSQAYSDAVTVRVQDRFTRGGAQVRGGRTTREIEFADNVDFSLGKKHAIRTGVLLEGGWYRDDTARNYAGTFTFSSRDAFDAGTPLQFSQRIGDPLVEYQFWEFGAFAQDDIKVRKNVMLSLGLRAEAQTHLGDALNLAPRLHVTWAPFKSNRTTLRAGAGIFYDWFEDSLYAQTLQLDGIRQRDAIIRNPGYPDPTMGGSAQVLPPSVLRAASNLEMPTVHRGSVGVEHAVTGWMQLRGNYFTQRTSNVFRSVNINAPVNGVRPLADLGNVSFIQAVGHEESQGMDVSASFNYAPKRIFGAINYRIAKSRADGAGATSLPVNGTDLAAEWGPTPGDVRHRLMVFGNLPIKWGFRANGSVRYESGRPYNVTTGFDDNGDGVINDRPAGVGRNSARGDAQVNADLRLSWSRGFGKPKTGDGQPGGGPVVIQRVGDGGRGGQGGGGGRGGPGGGGGGGGVMMMGGGPGGNNGRVNLEIFTQVFNLLNNVNYRSYSGVLTSNLFGQATSADMPRRIEVGLRVNF